MFLIKWIIRKNLCIYYILHFTHTAKDDIFFNSISNWYSYMVWFYYRVFACILYTVHNLLAEEWWCNTLQKKSLPLLLLFFITFIMPFFKKNKNNIYIHKSSLATAYSITKATSVTSILWICTFLARYRSRMVYHFQKYED